MIRTMLKPFLKKFLGLFISMAFVSMLAIGLLTAFASTIYNLKTTFRAYMESNETFGILFSDAKKYNALKKALGEILYRELRSAV